jgi:hypothetical protein
VGVADLTFQAIGLETLREYWPAFVAGAAAEVWLVRRIRRRRRFPLAWVVFAAIVPMCLSALLWLESFLATQFLYQTVGDGRRVETWNELKWHAFRSGPLLAPLGAVLLGLVLRPRSEAVVAALVALAGLLVSWLVAMWLFTTNHQQAIFQLLVLPGGIGAVAALVGFSTATAIWMGIGRWIWREGRRGSERVEEQQHRRDVRHHSPVLLPPPQQRADAGHGDDDGHPRDP